MSKKKKMQVDKYLQVYDKLCTNIVYHRNINL